MLPKNFLFSTLRSVSIFALYGTLLTSDFIASSKAMEVEESQKTTGTKRKRSTFNADSTRRPKRPRASSQSVPVIKEEPAHSRGLLTKEDIEEKMQLVNPRNGTRNCLKCAVSGYLMVKNQLHNPNKVNTLGPQADNLLPHRNKRDLDLVDFQQAVLLPSGKIQLTDNGEIWTEEFCIEDSKPITFKEKSIKEFHALFETMELNPWNNGVFQAGLLYLDVKDPKYGGHFLTLYSYQVQGEERFDLIYDFQHKECFPASDLETYINDYAFFPTLYVWYDAPGLQPLGERISMKQESDDSTSPLPSTISGEEASEEDRPTQGKVASKKRKKPRPITQEEINKISRLAEKGWNLEEIGEKLERDSTVVSKIAREHGIMVKRAPKKNHKKMTEEGKKDIERLAKKGFSGRQISRQLGYSKHQVSSCLEELEIDTKIITEEDLAKMVELREQNYTQQQIANEIGCGHSIVGYHLEKQGLSKRKAPLKRTEQVEDEIVKLKQAGQSTAEIAKELKCDKKIVLHVLAEKAPDSLRKMTKITSDLIEQMKTLKSQGFSNAKIANIIGCGESTVARHLREAAKEGS